MILRRLAVKNFRGIPSASLGPFSDRLNLFYGPNEVGKSTLVEALHFALFERASGRAEHKKAIRTWGATASPEVEVLLEDDEGRPWEIQKRFLDRAYTEVYIDDSIRLTGSAAEAKIRTLLGTRQGNSRGVPLADLGIWPLVWVRQGRAGMATGSAMNDDTRAALAATLAAKTGLMATSAGGSRLIHRVREEYRRWWTAQGRPTAAYRRTLDEAKQAQLDLDDVEDRLHAVRVMTDDLRRYESEALELEERIARQRQRLASARTVAEGAAQAREALELEQRAVALAEVALQQSQAAARQRRGLEEVHEASQLRSEEAVHRERELREQVQQLVTAARVLRDEASEAEAKAEDARGAVLALERGALRRVVATQRDALATRCSEAEDAAEQLRRVRDAMAATGVTVEMMSKLDEAVRRREEAEGTLAAATTRLVVTARREITLNGEQLAGGAVRVISLRDGTSLDVDGVVALGIQGDVAPEAVQAEARQARGAVERILTEMGVRDVETARARAAARRQLDSEAVALRARLEVLAPDGISGLRVELRRLTSQLGGLPEVSEAEQDREALERQATMMEGLAAAARARWEAAEDVAQRAREETAAARAQVAAHVAEVERCRGELAGCDSQDVLDEAVARCQHGLREARQRAAERQERFDASGGKLAARQLRDERAALEQLEGRRTRARAEVERCRARLEQRAEEGLYSRVTTARLQLRDKSALAQEQSRQAEAAKRAYVTVHDALANVQDRFAGPVREAVQEGVSLLFPGSTLAVDGQGEVVGLRTGSVVEAFDELSGGAREQLGVLVRLGLARVLSKGQRLPVILDDALVNSDAERRARMVEVLRRASDHLQLLVFTSHDEDFDRLGADYQLRVSARPRRVF